MITRIEAQDVKSAFEKSADLLHGSEFIHKMDLAFLNNGKLVERAICNTETYRQLPDVVKANDITCSWAQNP
jgi:hypothetical protein